MTLVLDAEALAVVARSPGRTGSGSRAVNTLRAALLNNEEVLVPAAVLADLYRGRQYDRVVDACLSRFPAVVVMETDRSLAKEIGHVLARAGRGSADHVDASVVAVAIRAGGGVIATADVDDLSALTEGLAGIAIEAV